MDWKFALILFACLILSSCVDKKSYNLPDNSDREESFNYFNFKTLIEEFPFDYQNPNQFYREFLKAKSTKHSSIHQRSLPEWESIGPTNIAGRSLCLAINPKDTNEIWMGSAGAGLWKSLTGGLGKSAWQNVLFGFPVISVSSIAIQSNQPNIMYVGTGELYNLEGSDGGIHTRTLRGSRGIGILKSIDGGLNWNLSLDWTSNTQTAVWKIIIHPKNPNVVFAATNIGIYKTVDGGTHWFNILNLPLAMDMVIDHQDPDILYAGIGGINGSHYGVYKTIDEGKNWKLIDTPNDTIYQGRIMLANYKGNPKRVYAAYSDAFKTIAMMRSRFGFDSVNFYIKIKNVSDHQGWYAKCLHIKDDDSSKLFMGGVDPYLDTTGTGNQLFNLMSRNIRIHADMHDIISNPYDANKIYIATDGGLYRSDDFGNSFYSCNHGFLSAQFYTGNISKSSNSLLGGLQDNRTVVYTSSLEWKNIHKGDGTYNAFHPDNDSMLYVSSQNQNLDISYNNGLNWKELIKSNAKAPFVSPFILNPNIPNKIYSGGKQLIYSDDNGNTWDTCFLKSNDEMIMALENDPIDFNKIYISTLDINSKESHLYTFEEETSLLINIEEGIPERFIRDIAIDPRKSSVIYLALGGTGFPGIIRSDDAGLHWSFPANQDLPDVPFHSILIDPKDNNIIYAGCDFGLYASFDQGIKWISYNTHFYDLVPVYDIKYSPIEDKLILFTHGLGAFRCPLLEKAIPTSTQNSDISSYLIYYFNNHLILSSCYDGIMHITLTNIAGIEIKLKRNNIGFDLGYLNPGIYYILSNDRSLNGKKIVVTR